MNEAELLFTQIFNCDRASLYLNKERVLGRDNSSLVSSVLKRRISGEPIQYILGKTEFMGLEFKVNKDVFIPRPETEILAEVVIKIVRDSKFMVNSILDLCTGSGCIAISLAKFLFNVKITATDISPKAIEIASYNARLNNVTERIEFIKSDLFTQYAIRNTQYDIIVSNPPYIPSAEIDNLQPEISYEPRIALDGGKDGLEIYRKIIHQAPRHLQQGGFLILEMGFNQAKEIKNIFQKYGNFKILKVIKDYNNIDRVIVAKNIS